MPYQQIIKTELDKVYLIEPKIFGDKRGWYCPQLEVSELESAIGTKLRITQEGESFSEKRGTLRGIHYQKPTTQGKLVRVVSGKVLDVAVDLRKRSLTFGKYVAYELSADNRLQLWIPAGFAHGYLTLEDNTRFSYIVTDGIYDKAAEKGVNPFDPRINIIWPFSQTEMNLLPRDLALPNLEDISEGDIF